MSYEYPGIAKPFTLAVITKSPLDNMKREKVEILNQEYARLNKSLDSFGQELSEQIQQIFDENKIVVGFPIQHRTKTWTSVEKKLKNLTVKSILDIQDLCGLRFVLLFKRDISKVKEIISQNFKVLKQYDTHDRLGSDQFGYSSFHMIIQMPESWFTIPTLKNFKELKAEIQIRTMAQHTWAAASHILQYKTDDNVPKAILRSVYRVSAILETVDIEFERFLEEREEYLAKLNSLSADEISEYTLNVNSLEKILDENLPLKNKDAEEEYSDLLDDLKIFDITKSNELVEIINKHKSAILDHDIKLGMNEEGKEHYFNHSGLLRYCLKLENPTKWEILLQKWKDEDDS